MRFGSKLVLALGVLGATSGCDWLEEFKSCRDMRIDIVNSEQTVSAVNIAAPGEDFTPGNLLESGQSRQIILCVDRGDTVKFRAAKDGLVLAVARCVVEKSSGEGSGARVTWTLRGFLCEGW